MLTVDTAVNGLAMSWYYSGQERSAWEHQVEAAADTRLNVDTQITGDCSLHYLV
jgi:hypothetical protein